MGADLRLDPGGFDIGIRPSWEQALADVEASGGRVRDSGRSVRPRARRSWLRALGHGGGGAGAQARRLLRHGRRLLRYRLDPGRHDRRLRPSGTRANGARHRRVRDGRADLDQIAGIARRTAEAIGLGRELVDAEIVLLDEWHAGTYGIPDEKTIEAIRVCARLEGVLTDPVYEGKSMAALIDLVQSGRVERGSRVLYAHLGGQPALNAYAGPSRQRFSRRQRDAGGLACPRDTRRSEDTMLKQLSHTGVWVTDQDEALAFYTEKLGLEDSGGRHRARDGASAALGQGARARGHCDHAAGDSRPPVFDEETSSRLKELVAKGAGGSGLFFQTDDIQRAYEELKGAASSSRRSRPSSRAGRRGLRDPAGNQMRMAQMSQQS